MRPSTTPSDAGRGMIRNDSVGPVMRTAARHRPRRCVIARVDPTTDSTRAGTRVDRSSRGRTSRSSPDRPTRRRRLGGRDPRKKSRGAKIFSGRRGDRDARDDRRDRAIAASALSAWRARKTRKFPEKTGLRDHSTSIIELRYCINYRVIEYIFESWISAMRMRPIPGKNGGKRAGRPMFVFPVVIYFAMKSQVWPAFVRPANDRRHLQE